MKLITLTITNFRKVRYQRIDFTGRAALMLGINGQGKSTTLDAIRVLLFGRCHDCNGKKIPLADLKFLGAAVIEGVFDTPKGIITAKLTIGKETKLHFTDSNKEALYSANAEIARADFFRDCGIDQEHAELAANPHLYLGGSDSADIGSMLSRLNGGINQKALAEDCGDYWPWVERFARNHRTGTASVEQLEALGREADTARCDTKKQMADEKKRAEVARESAGGNQHNQARLDSAQQTMTGLEKDRLALAERLGRAQQAAEAGLSPEERAELTAQLEALKDEDAQLADHIGKAEAAAQQAEALARGRGTAIDQARGNVLSLDSVLGQARSALESAKGGNCPTCGAKISKKVIDDARAAVNAAEANKAAAETEHEKAQASYRAAQDAAQAARAKVQPLRDKRQEVREAMRDAEAKLAVPVATETPEAVQAEIDEVEKRMGKGRVLIAQLEAARDADTHATNAAAYAAEVARLDWAVKAFRDGEVSNKYAGDAVRDFAKAASERLAPYGYGMDVRIAGKRIDVLLVAPDGVPVPYAQASKGERVLAQWAVSSLAPEAIACVDDLDALWGEFKGVLISELGKRSEGMTLAAGTWGLPGFPDAEKLTKAMAIQVIRINAGRDAAKEAA